MVSKLISTVLLLSFVFGISVFGQDSSGVGTEGTVIDLDLSLIGINRIHQAYPWLDGSGIRVSIQEEAFDTMDADLLGRYLDVGLTSRVSAKHATNMATVIAGAGNTSIRGLGVAYGALISSSNLMGRIPDPLNVYRQNDIFLQNHSYGDTNAVSYNHQSIAFDQSMFEESRLLHVFSSGNNGVGNGETSLGQINGGANLTGSMKQAKNPIIIGAIDTIERIQLFSSRGPTLDGRIKPDLVTFALFGSSNAAALTSGVCALLQHAYLDQYGTYPSAALLKAALIQSAKDIDEPGPDYQSGFGSLDAFAAVQVIMEERFKESSLTGKDTYTENWLVPESTEQIRIALAWIDPPASDEMEKLLVHDLDLQVVTPVGDTLRPWTIPFTNISDLTARRGRDSLNNVEVFTLQNAEAGIYQLLVSANLPAGATQGFSLAYGSQAPDRFHWLYPLATDPVPFNGEAFTYVQWDTDFTGVGILEAPLPGPCDWTILSDNISLANARWRWEIPVTMQGLSRLRIRTQNQTYTSDTFRISHPVRPNITFSCGDSLLFEWPPTPGADKYRIYIQDGAYLTPVQETFDTLFFWRKPDFPNTQIAVEPIFAERSTALKSQSFSIGSAEDICYFKALYVDNLNEKNGLGVLAELSTRWNIQDITWQHRGLNQPYRDKRTYFPTSDSLYFFDDDPIEGLNFYRLLLRTNDGKIYTSEEAISWYVNASRVRVFPNPVQRGQEVNIYTRPLGLTENAALYCYNAAGQLVIRYDFMEERMTMATRDLPPGYYVVEVRGVGEVVRQPLIIH